MVTVFRTHLQEKRNPSFPECREPMQKYPELQKRSVQTLKAWINIQIRKTETKMK